MVRPQSGAGDRCPSLLGRHSRFSLPPLFVLFGPAVDGTGEGDRLYSVHSSQAHLIQKHRTDTPK